MFKRIRRHFNRRHKSGFSRNASVASATAHQHQLSDFDSSSLCSTSSDDVEGPTLITVDDGKGGIRHVRVSKPPDTQSEVGFLLEDASSPTGAADAAGGGGEEDLPVIVRNQRRGGEPTIGELLRREFRGRQIFHLDSDLERLRKRIVSKKGVVHIGRSHLEGNQRRKYLSDFFNTMLDMKWRYVLLIFTMSFFVSWLVFAVVWYLLLLLRGDFAPDHLPARQDASNWQPCVYAIHGFASCFLFSIETQHTIGYGSRQTSEKCPEAILVMSFQSVVGVMIQACMVGTIFAKLSRPKRRAQTLLFSKNAVVCRRDGHLCLCFRMANMRSSHLVECHTRAILVSKKVTEEGEHIPYHQTELNVGTDMDGREDSVFFIWPLTIVHRIDEDSPFYHMSARDFLKKRYELIVVLEGIAEPTGMSVQARTSYLPNEILWGYRFVNVLNYKRRDGVYKIDYGLFNELVKVETPISSAKAQAAMFGKQPQSDVSGSGNSTRHSTSKDEKSATSQPVKRQQSLQHNPQSSLRLHAQSMINHVSLPCLPQGKISTEGCGQVQKQNQINYKRKEGVMLRQNSTVPVFSSTTAFVP